MATAFMSEVDPQFVRECTLAIQAFKGNPVAASVKNFWQLYGGVSSVDYVNAGTVNTPGHFLVSMNVPCQILCILGAQNLQQRFATYASTFTDLDGIDGWEADTNTTAGGTTVTKNILPKIANKSQRLIIFGHSIGGAIAPCVMLLLSRLGYNFASMSVVTIGSPRPGFPSFAKACGFNGVRWMTPIDPIPYFPLHPDEAVGAGAWYNALGSVDWPNYVHPFTGCVVDVNGNMVFQPLPQKTNPTAWQQYVALITGLKSADDVGHSTDAYVSYLTVAINPANRIYIRSPDDPQPKTDVSVLHPPVFPIDKAFTPSSKQETAQMAAFIPTNDRFIAKKVSGNTWCVMWQGLVVTSEQTRSNAKACAKWGNKWLRVLGTAEQIHSTNFPLALSAFFVQAGQPGNGFNPVWLFVP